MIATTIVTLVLDFPTACYYPNPPLTGLRLWPLIPLRLPWPFFRLFALSPCSRAYQCSIMASLTVSRMRWFTLVDILAPLWKWTLVLWSLTSAIMSVSRRSGPAPDLLLILPSCLQLPFPTLLLWPLTLCRVLLLLLAPQVPIALMPWCQHRRNLLILQLTSIQVVISMKKNASSVVSTTCVFTVETPATWWTSALRSLWITGLLVGQLLLDGWLLSFHLPVTHSLTSPQLC